TRAQGKDSVSWHSATALRLEILDEGRQSIRDRPARRSIQPLTRFISYTRVPHMSSTFASTGDTAEKKITFGEIGPKLYAFTADGDPNSGVIVGDDGAIVIDAQATPALAHQVIERVRSVTDKPIKYVVLSHYHAVRVLGASAYVAQEIIASETCRAM